MHRHDATHEDSWKK